MLTYRTLRLTAPAALLLGILACTCGPMTELTQTFEQVQDAAPTFEALSTEMAAAEATFSQEEANLDGGTDGAAFEEGGDTEGQAGSVDYCGLLSDAELQALFGASPSNVEPIPGDATSGGCTYTGTPGQVYTVSIVVLPSAAEAATTYDLATSFLPGTSEEISGPWDAGTYTDTAVDGASAGAPIITYYIGSTYVTIVSFGVERQAAIDSAMALAERLP